MKRRADLHLKELKLKRKKILEAAQRQTDFSAQEFIVYQITVRN
jgi:hypothetical protein